MSNRIEPNLYIDSIKTTYSNDQKDIMGKDSFLKILMTQLQNQDPMNPLEDKDFIAQMATFSSLEQLTNINKTLEKLGGQSSGTSLLSYSSMIGKQIDFVKNVDDNLLTGSGIVKSIIQKGNDIEVELGDGTRIKNTEITKLSNPIE